MVDNTEQPKGTHPAPVRPLSSAPFIILSIATILSAFTALTILLETAPTTAFLLMSDTPAEDPVSSNEAALSAGDGGQFSVEESGYSIMEDAVGDSMISWGAILVNTSEKVAASAGVAVRLIAEDGSKVEMMTSTQDVGPIPPGGRVGVGDETYISSPDIADFQLATQEVRWWPVDSDKDIADFSVSEIETRVVGEGDPIMHWDDDDGISEQVSDGELHLRFRVESKLRTVVTKPGAAAVFRDKSGEIVGGATMSPLDSSTTVPPGWSYQEFWVKEGPPADTDESSIEVFVRLYR